MAEQSVQYLHQGTGGNIIPINRNFPPSHITITPSISVATDIWRKPGPPKIDTFNAPVLYRSIPLKKFQSVRITVAAKWRELYDQGGLVFILPAEKGKEKERKWIKSGIEFYEGEAYVSTVACDRWADWSLVQTGIKNLDSGEKEVTLEMERREKDATLWVYVVDGEKKVPVREVTWALSDIDRNGDGGEKVCWVGVYAATPTVGEGRSELEVRFEGLKYEDRE
jgi:regulation of enolase protein 1 (concanavalin A-like superfamily)